MLAAIYAILREGRTDEQLDELDDALGLSEPEDLTEPTPVELRPAWLTGGGDMLTVA